MGLAQASENAVTDHDRNTRDRFERGPLRRLRRLGLWLRAYTALDGIAILSAGVLAAVLITLAIDRTARLSWDMRLAQLVSLGLILLLTGWRLLISPLRIPVTPESLAMLVERRNPSLQDRLVSAVEFFHAHHRPAEGSKPLDPLRRAVIEQGAALTMSTHTEVLNHRRARRRGGIVLACLAAVTALVALVPETMGLWFERNVLLQRVEWPRHHQLTVEGLQDGRIVVARGDDVTISARVDPGFHAPRQVYVEYSTRQGATATTQMPAIEGNVIRFTHTFDRIDESYTCTIRGGDARTDPFEIEVVDRPRVETVHLGVVPPSYTRQEPYELRIGERSVEALAGSEIRFRITTSKPIANISLHRLMAGENDEIPSVTRIADQTYLAVDRPLTSAEYHFELSDSFGLSNISQRSTPLRFGVRMLEDQPPAVKIELQGVGDMITPEAVIPIRLTFTDTYGLATAELVCQTTRPRDASVQTQPSTDDDAASENRPQAPVAETVSGFTPRVANVDSLVDWSAGAHGCRVGDRLTLFGRATDFNDVSGPGTGESVYVVLRVVDANELLAELARREQEYRQDFERLLSRQIDLYQELLTLTDAHVEDDEPQKRDAALHRNARTQRDQAGRMGASHLQFEQILSELRVNRLATPAIEERLGRGVIKPIGELARQTMPEAAQAIEALIQNRSPEAIRRARDLEDLILAQMNMILSRMLQWERFQEAVILLRDVIRMQEDVYQETEKAIEDRLFGPDNDGVPIDESP